MWAARWEVDEAPDCERPQRAAAMRPHRERADPVPTEAVTRTEMQADRAKAEPERVEPQAVEVQRAGRRGVVVERA